MPRSTVYCDLERLRRDLGRPVLFGHRGLPGDRVENCLDAFRRAITLGADGIECDLQLTIDGVPVVAHDRDLLRVTGQPGTINKSTAAQLRHLGLPCLDEVLEQLSSHAVLNLEIKETRVTDGGLESTVVDAIARHNAQARVVFSSFSPFALARLRRLDPNYHTGLLIAPGMRHGSWAARLGGATAIHPHAAQMDGEFVVAWRRRGYRIVVWGDRDKHELRRLQRMDVDGIITDHLGVGNDPSA